MSRLIMVKLRELGQAQIYNTQELQLKEGDCVIVEHDRGLDYGEVICPKKGALLEQAAKESPKKIVRLAKEADYKQIEDNRVKAKEAFNTCAKKIA